MSLAGSWANEVTAIAHGKRLQSWPPDVISAAHGPRVTSSAVKAKERLFNPLLGMPRAESAEAGVVAQVGGPPYLVHLPGAYWPRPLPAADDRAQEAARAAAAVAKGLARSLRFTQAHDIINGQPKSWHDPDVAGTSGARSPPRSGTGGFNLLSGLPEAVHSALPPGARPPLPPPVAGRTAARHAPLRRDWDVLSCEYTGHDALERKESDARAAAERSSALFRSSRSFNPVACSYFDEDREAEFLTTRRAASAVHGVERAQRLPPSVRTSEGALYNVITHSVFDADRLREADLVRARHGGASIAAGAAVSLSPQHSVAARFAAANAVRDAAAYDLSESRKLNRISSKRFEHTVDHDIVSGARLQRSGLEGAEGAAAGGALPLRPQTVWARLSAAGSLMEPRRSLSSAMAPPLPPPPPPPLPLPLLPPPPPPPPPLIGEARGAHGAVVTSSLASVMQNAAGIAVPRLAIPPPPSADGLLRPSTRLGSHSSNRASTGRRPKRPNTSIT
jgi:hypothetical protein